MTESFARARRRPQRLWLVGAALAVLVALPAFAHAAVGSVTEFSNGVTANAAPQSITAGPDGNLWFTESAANKIGRITPAGVVTEFTDGLSAGANPWGITSGPDGNLWFTERSTSKIGRITPQGVITEFATFTPNAAPWGITAGSDGNLWFTENGINSVGRITTAGVQLAEIPLCVGCADGSTGGQGIVAGPDGNVWAVGYASNAVYQLPIGGTTPAVFTSGITAGAGLAGITVGSDNNLWFTEQLGNRVGRITVAGAVTEFVIALAAQSPTGITSGADGALWVGENGTGNNGNNLVRVTTAGVMTQYQNGIVANAGIYGVTAGPDGNLWFAESNSNRIGRMLSGIVPVNVAPPRVSGSPTVGSTLAVSNGSWKYLPTTYAYKWFRCTTAAATKCKTIVKKTKSSYAIRSADAGSFLRASVTPTNSNGEAKPTPSPTASQVPTSFFSITRPSITYKAKSVVLTSTITTKWAGKAVQTATSKVGSKVTRRCIITKRTAVAGTATIVCRLQRASRQTLRKQSLKLTITTTFTATGGAASTRRQVLTVPRRVNPTATQDPTSFFSITRPRITYKAKSVVLTSRITTNWAGKAVQAATSKRGRKVTRRCIITKRTRVAGVARIVCRLQRASRQTLRKQSLKLRITTTFTATGGAAKYKTQILTVPKRFRP
jgi:streptogramin lyase